MMVKTKPSLLSVMRAGSFRGQTEETASLAVGGGLHGHRMPAWKQQTLCLTWVSTRNVSMPSTERGAVPTWALGEAIERGSWAWPEPPNQNPWGLEPTLHF